MRLCRLAIYCLCLCLLFSAPLQAASDVEVAAWLQRLSSLPAIDSEPLRSRSAVQRFYAQRDYQPAWSHNGTLTATVDELLQAVLASSADGFDPRTYHLTVLTDYRRQWPADPPPQALAKLDVLLSDAFLLLARHALNGRLDPALVDPNWHIPRETGDAVRILNQALSSGRLRDTLAGLLPQHPTYANLRQAYNDYLRLAANGGWPRLTFKPPLRPGASGPAVRALRQRLALEGDLVDESSGSDFDLTLTAAVQRFQYRHGLAADGVVGPATLAALNVPAVLRARQLAVNLERWRWLPRQLGDRYLLVNLPAFQLVLVEPEQPPLEMRTIVGRQLRQTPAFVGHMTYLVLNPYWEVPRRLAVEDILPKIQANPAYLHQEGFRVFTADRTPVAADEIDWQQADPHNFPWQLRQEPGRKNALGRIKFMFPNEHSIYLHDTPNRRLFERPERSFSSGCIRIEKPLELAQRLLQGTSLADPAALEQALLRATNRTVLLPRPVTVYLIYATAWATADGTVHFQSDLYQRDRRLADALSQPFR